jgi:hypothetical protein
MLTGCHETQMKRCVNQNNVVVDESFCQTPAGQQNNNYYYPPGVYHYYYGGSGGFSPGSVATGGAVTPSAGVSYSTSRGGFGSTFGGGESGGE